MATKLLICPSVISPMDKLDVESLRILLYIIACGKGINGRRENDIIIKQQ